MFNNSESAIQLFIKGHETVYVPFKFQNFKTDNITPELVSTYQQHKPNVQKFDCNISSKVYFLYPTFGSKFKVKYYPRGSTGI